MNFSNIILVLAAAQGLLLSLLILQKHRAIFANRFLGLLMFGYTLVLVHLLLQDTGIYKDVPWTFLISAVPLATMPLHYLYVYHLIHRSSQFERKELFHFLPFGIYEIILIVAASFSLIDFSSSSVADVSQTPIIFKIFNGILILQGIGYLSLSIRTLNRYNAHLKDIVSSLEQVQLTWLRNFSLAGLVALGIFLAEDLFLLYGINLSNFIISSLGFAFYVYGIGYTGLLKTEIFADPIVKRVMNEMESIKEKEVVNSGKYERSGLTDEFASEILRSLIDSMEKKKIYRNSSLTLTELAEELSISTHNLSEVINTKLKKNFYDFVNGYRLEEVKKDLIDPTKQHLKILSLAFDAGFNSKATFNTLFKEQTEKTPSEFRKDALQTTIVSK